MNKIFKVQLICRGKSHDIIVHHVAALNEREALVAVLKAVPDSVFQWTDIQVQCFETHQPLIFSSDSPLIIR